MLRLDPQDSLIAHADSADQFHTSTAADFPLDQGLAAAASALQPLDQFATQPDLLLQGMVDALLELA